MVYSRPIRVIGELSLSVDREVRRRDAEDAGLSKVPHGWRPPTSSARFRGPYAGPGLFFLLSAAVAAASPGCSLEDEGIPWRSAGACEPAHNVVPRGLDRCAVMRGLEGKHYVAISVPYTGGRYFLGLSLEPPLVLAVTEANANGGIAGECIGVIKCDTESEPNRVGAAILDELSAIPEVGYLYAGGTANLGDDALEKLAQYQKVASYMSGSAADHEASGGYYFVGFPGTHGAISQGFAMYLDTIDQGAARVAGYAPTAENLGVRLRKQGYDAQKAVGTATVPDFEIFVIPDLGASVVSHALAHGVDMLYTEGNQAEILAMVDQAAIAGYRPLGWYLATNPEWIKDTPHADYRAMIRAAELKDTPTTQTFIDNYVAAFSVDPVNDGSEGAYDFGCAGLLAMRAASDPTDGPSVREAMFAVFRGTAKATDCAGAFAKLNEGATGLAYVGPSGFKGFDDGGVCQGHQTNVYSYDPVTGAKTERLCFSTVDASPCE